MLYFGEPSQIFSVIASFFSPRCDPPLIRYLRLTENIYSRKAALINAIVLYAEGPALILYVLEAFVSSGAVPTILR